MSNKRDSDHEMDIYIIPQNFIEGGKVFGGMFRFRNAVEAIVLAVISGYPIMASSANLYPKIILMCCIPLPLTLFGLIGIGDDSLTEFIINFFVWLRRRRILGEEPDIPYEEKPAKWYRPQWLMSAVKAVRAKMPFRKVEADEADYEIVYYDSEDEIPPDAARWDDFQNKELPVMLRTPAKQKKEKRKKRGKHKKNGKSKAKPAAAKEKKGKGKKKPASKRPDKAQTMEEFLPIDKIENGIVHTKDGRYIRILEIEPINFLLRSPREQRNIIFSFASMLKITPIKLQFKVISKKADVNQHLNTMRKHMGKEEDPRVRELQQDYFNLIRRIGSREAVTRRFFMIFEYQNPLATRRVEYKEIVAMLETTTRNARSYLAQCGNEVVQHENEDEFISEVFYTLLNRKTSVNTPLQERVTQTLAKYIVEDGDRNMDDVTVNELIAPTSLDLTHSRYLIMDNLYYSYLIIPADAYKSQVVAGWLSLIVNAGEGIDCDLYFHKEPKERVQMKIGQQIRINRSKIKDTSDTNTDFDDLDNAIRSGYYLKRGISNNEDFYYLSIIISICASNLRDLDWRVAEMKKLLISQDMDARVCSFQQENAFLSTLPIAAIDKKLYAKSRRNLLTTSAASCYPFTSFEMSDDAGILMGVNKFNNSMIIVDIFNSKIYKNANIAILGASGGATCCGLKRAA